MYCDVVCGNKNYFTRKNQMTWKPLSFYMIGWRIEFPGYALFIFSYLLIYIILVSFFCSSGRFISNLILHFLMFFYSSSSSLLPSSSTSSCFSILLFFFLFFFRPSNNCPWCFHQRGRSSQCRTGGLWGMVGYNIWHYYI